MQDSVCVVLVTCGSRENAEAIAEKIVVERLAACVNLFGDEGNPIRSFYVWEGALQREQEYLLMIKTRVSRLSGLERRIRELHSYEMPEFIALPVMSGSEQYLEWVRQNVE